MNGHLGDRVAALVDGELTHDARDRVLAHLTSCAVCRAEVDAARAIKQRVAALATPEPPVEPSASLLLALLNLGDSGPHLPGGGDGGLPVVKFPGVNGAGPADPAGLTGQDGAGGQRHRGRVVMVGVCSVAAVTVGSALMFTALGGTAHNGGASTNAQRRSTSQSRIDPATMFGDNGTRRPAPFGSGGLAPSSFGSDSAGAPLTATGVSVSAVLGRATLDHGVYGGR
jgi:hypothetical protein